MRDVDCMSFFVLASRWKMFKATINKILVSGNNYASIGLLFHVMEGLVLRVIAMVSYDKSVHKYSHFYNI